MKRVVIVGSWPGLSTGYGKIMYSLLKQLDTSKDLAIFVYGIQRAKEDVRKLDFVNTTLYDAMGNEKEKSDGFGMHEIAAYVAEIKPDIVMIYNDVYTTHHYIEQVKELKKTMGFKILAYYDMFYPNFYTKYVENISENVDNMLVFSDYWMHYLKGNLGLPIPIDILYHGFDETTFYPKDQQECRRKLGIPEKAFVILNLNRNLTRKRMDVFLMALARVFVANPTDPMFCIINTNKEWGFDVYDILQQELRDHGVAPEDIPKHTAKVMLNHMALPDEMINDMYNAADIGVNTAEGEGVGLCQLEGAGVGRPQVISNVGGMGDIFDNTFSIKINPVASYYLDCSTRDAIGGKAEILDPRHIADGIEFYFKNPSIRLLHGERARKHVLQHKYKWTTIGKKLGDVFASM